MRLWKVHRPQTDFAQVVIGVAVPEPIAMQSIGRTAMMTVDATLNLPKPIDMRLRRRRALLAKELANFVYLATNSSGGRALKHIPHSRLAVTTSDPRRPYAKFDNHRFSLKSTEPQSAWLNDIAAECIVQATSVRSRSVVGHFDWRIENVRIRGYNVVAVLDLDLDSLAVAVARAARRRSRQKRMNRANITTGKQLLNTYSVNSSTHTRMRQADHFPLENVVRSLPLEPGQWRPAGKAWALERT